MSIEHPHNSSITYSDFSIFYTETYDAMLRFVNGKIKDESIAEELTQDAYLSIFSKNYESWDIGLAYKTTYRKIIDLWRSLRYRSEVHVAKDSDNLDYDDAIRGLATEGHISPEFKIEVVYAVEALKKALRPDYMDLIRLDSEDRSHEDIAKMVGRTKKGVKAALFKARKDAQAIIAVKGL